jgi:hypothetical protein
VPPCPEPTGSSATPIKSGHGEIVSRSVSSAVRAELLRRAVVPDSGVPRDEVEPDDHQRREQPEQIEDGEAGRVRLGGAGV